MMFHYMHNMYTNVYVNVMCSRVNMLKATEMLEVKYILVTL